MEVRVFSKGMILRKIHRVYPHGTFPNETWFLVEEDKMYGRWYCILLEQTTRSQWLHTSTLKGISWDLALYLED